MRVSLDWIKEFVDVRHLLRMLPSLTMAGLEIEAWKRSATTW